MMTASRRTKERAKKYSKKFNNNGHSIIDRADDDKELESVINIKGVNSSKTAGVGVEFVIRTERTQEKCDP